MNNISSATEYYKEVLKQDNTHVEAIACIGSNRFYSDQPEIALRFYRYMHLWGGRRNWTHGMVIGLIFVMLVAKQEHWETDMGGWSSFCRNISIKSAHQLTNVRIFSANDKYISSKDLSALCLKLISADYQNSWLFG